MTAQRIAQQHDREVPIIPAPRGGVTVLCAQTFLAVLAGLALRLLFVFQFPMMAGDSDLYLQLSRNLADHHVYGLWLNGHLVPTDLRMPGYPAFVAGVGMLFRRSMMAITLSQAVLDLGTCFLTAVLAAALAPALVRRRAWFAGLWLAMTCPFVANYSAVVLTEILVALFTTGALVCFALGLRKVPGDLRLMASPRHLSPFGFVLLGAFLTGLATLLRPEMPLLLAAAGLIYALRWWRFLGFRKIAITGAAMAGMLLIPLVPWAVRNFVTLREIQIISPRYATLPGEYAPVGYYQWTQTWLERYRDVYTAIWNVGEEPVNVEDLPPTAFDSPQERAHVQALFDDYNKEPDMDISPEVDREFAKIARERTRRHPFRTYVQVPFQRALTIWFTPRTELLPIDGKLWPLRDQWRDSHADVLTTAGFGVLGYLYAALAIGGVWFTWRVLSKNGVTNISEEGANLWGITLLLTYILVRTIFLTTVEAPEPRYVVSCYPAVLAMAALLFSGGRRKTN